MADDDEQASSPLKLLFEIIFAYVLGGSKASSKLLENQYSKLVDAQSIDFQITA